MGKEIERKFLVNISAWEKLDKPAPLHTVQAYLSKNKNAVVRIRIKGDEAFITIKGKNEGISRTEFEYNLPLEEASDILAMSKEKRIEKHRYLIPVASHLWEVDVFLGENKGLVLAEVELEFENENFVLPDWVLEEVSNEAKYYNVNLIEKPFSDW